MLFSINCVEIISKKDFSEEERSQFGPCDKRLYKGLKSKRYFFNDFYEHNQKVERLLKKDRRIIDENFFGPNINVQAVVGENGSGKSTLMELIYMAINNFSYMYERGHDAERPGAESLYYVPGLFVKIYFSLGTVIYELESKGLVLDLRCNGSVIGHFVIDEHGAVNPMLDKEIADLIDNFFYTIATNYSLHSFNPVNYIHEVYVFESGRDRKITKVDVSKEIWINSIFHKNDGYIRSIVLNPYRDDGHIDIKNELNLSKDRVCTLFLWAKEKGKSYFSPYVYCDLKIELKKNFLKNKIKNFWKLSSAASADFDKRYPTDKYCLEFIDDKFSDKLVREFLLNEELLKDNWDNCDEYKKKAMLYLQLKILTIVNKYDVFLDYKDVVKFDRNEVNPKIKFEEGEKCNRLIDLLKAPEWHVTKKIRRTTSFMKLSKNAIEKVFSKKASLNGELYFDELSDAFFYQNSLFSPFNGSKSNGGRHFIDPVRIDRMLPPSIFEYELILKKGTDSISFNNLSSGELQLLETLSVHSYHIENILSVNREYANADGSVKYHPKYKCVNLVFDEVEMCFHPDFQRQFVNRLLDLITSMKQNWYGNGGCCLNIIILTHSPFILSDIPKSNILYLQDGKDVSDSIDLNPFGANVSDALFHSFFLKEKGFVGEFAKRKIESLSEYLLNNRNEKYPNSEKFEWSEDWANSFLEKIIGDEMIRNVLKQMKES